MHHKSILFLIISFTGIGLLANSCSPTKQIPEITQTNEPVSVAESPSPAVSSLGAETFLTADEVSQLMTALLIGPDYQKAVDTILAANDPRFIAVFIELMRANQIGLLQGAGYQSHVAALEALSGQSFGDDWPAWIEWYGAADLIPPPGFTSWKGEVLGIIDPGFKEFLQDDFPSNIRIEEIQWGGVLVDGIPALDNAAMISPLEAAYLQPEEPVFGISINGDHRAYPLRILDWHEMANDVVGGVPVSLAYCTLCGAGIAFDGRALNGDSYTFGSSGFLYRSNKLMYDRQTRTLWNQLTGEPVLGELVGSGIKLKYLPVVVTSWQSWSAQHPDTLVLDINTGYSRPYEPGAAYGAYFADDATMFPVWQRSSLLETKDRIYALQVEGIPIAYPLDILIDEKVLNDTVGKTNVVLVAAQGDITVQSDPSTIYNAGGEVRAYLRAQESFIPGPDAGAVLDSAGRSWQVTEGALIGPDDEKAPRINGHLAYWFGWYAFFPNTVLYGE